MKSQNKYSQIKPFIDGYKAVRENYLWGIIDNNDNIIVPCIYDYIGKRGGSFFINFRGTERVVLLMISLGLIILYMKI